MPTPKKPDWEFDEQKLEKMAEPLTVSVVRMVNGQREPVIIPPLQGESVPGKGYVKDDVRQLSLFLRDKWCGAGSYELQAVGSNGEKMRWKAYFPENKFPVLQDGKLISMPPAPGEPQQTTPVGGGQLAGYPTPQPAMPPQIPTLGTPWNGAHATPWQTPWHSPPPYQSPYQSPYQQQQQSQFGPGSEAAKAREDVVKMEGRLERERQEAAHKADMAAITQEFRRVQESLTAKPAESEEAKLLRQEIAELKRGASDDKFTRMIEDSKRDTQALIQQMQAQHQQQMAALSAKPAGPDPTMMLVVEAMKASSEQSSSSARAQVEAQKEIARMQADVQRESARTAMRPQDIFDMMSRANVNQEQMANAYGKVWELMQQGMEVIMGAQAPSTHPALEMIGQGLQGGLGVAQEYIQMKQQSNMADAQVRAVQAQAAAQPAQPAHQRPGATIEQGQLGAPSSDVPPDNIGAEETDEDAVERPSPQEITETEQQLFGPALEAVQGLRQRVASGLAKPEQVAAAVIQGINHFVGEGQVVPAFDLWASGDLAGLVECLIPDAPTSFQERVIEHLFAVRTEFEAQAAKAAKDANARAPAPEPAA